ncbi:hypothetical protein BHM03_00017356 [Ensete ventricosum]|nr:hypothetical protein BHM03_00017356 [Ensete ventricosum]
MRIQPVVAGIRSRSAGGRRRPSAMQRGGREERQEELVLPVVVLRHLQRQPAGELRHVLHPGHLWLGTGLRHPHRRHGHLRGLLPLRLSLLRQQEAQDPQQPHPKHHPSGEARCDERRQIQNPQLASRRRCCGA